MLKLKDWILARRLVISAVLGLSLFLPACSGPSTGAGAGSSTAPASSATTTPSAGQSSPSVQTGGSTAPATTADKLLVIVEENRSAGEAAKHMPYLLSQAQAFGSASDYYALAHPSLPNYLAIAGGSTFGVRDDHQPDQHPLAGSSVFGQVLASGHVAKIYAEAMQGNCQLQNAGTYAVKHNPWAYFMDSAERTGCQKYDVPAGSPSAGSLHDDVAGGSLPTLGLLIPDLCNDGHDCPAGTADAWLRGWLPQVKAGPDYRSGHLTIVVTFDEDDKTSGNRVMTVVIHPSLQGRQVTTRLDHYSLSASISRLAGAQPLRNAANAPDLLAAFSL